MRERLSEGSSNSYVCHLRLSYIFTSSHSHIHIFPYYIFLFTSSHTHTFTLTLTHFHIFTNSHLLFFSLSLSHLHIFTHIFKLTLSYLPSLTSSHTDICFFFLSHSHLHIFTFSLSLPSFLSPCSLSPFSLSRLLYLLSLGRGWCRRGVMKRQPFRTKWGSMRKNQGMIAILLVPDLSRRTFRTK